MTKQTKALKLAIDRAGGQTELAERVSLLLKSHPHRPMRKRVVTQAIVATWVKRGRAAADMCPMIEQATGVSRCDLRPDTHVGCSVELNSASAKHVLSKDSVHG